MMTIQAKRETEAYYETTDLPEEIRGAMWDEAERRGHSGGEEEVSICYGNLVDFTRTMLDLSIRHTLRNMPPAF